MDAPDPRPEDPPATKAAVDPSATKAAVDPSATKAAVVDPSATKAAVERGRDAERSRWGLVLIAAVVLVAGVVAWKGAAIFAFFAGPR